jgi:hypothetical protein
VNIEKSLVTLGVVLRPPKLSWALVLGTLILGTTALPGKVEAAPAHNAVTLWNERTQPVLATWTGRGNAAQAYTGSLVQIAVYDAVVAIRGGYRPFYADVNAPAGADLNAAIATAAYGVTRSRVDVATPARNTLDDQYIAYLAAIPDGKSKADGIAVGTAAAAATLAARAGDNFYDAAVYENPPPAAGVWQATSVADAYATAGANDYAMSRTIPVTRRWPGARRPRPPIAMAKKAYARALLEVQETGRKDSPVRTPEMTRRRPVLDGERLHALDAQHTRHRHLAKSRRARVCAHPGRDRARRR